MTEAEVEKLERGNLVVAARDITYPGIMVPKGMFGVVFEPAGYYDPDDGPTVRWFNGEGFCVFVGDVNFPNE